MERKVFYKLPNIYVLEVHGEGNCVRIRRKCTKRTGSSPEHTNTKTLYAL